MIMLPQSLAAWGKEYFSETFKAEVEQCSAELLPLQQALTLSSYVSAEPFRVMVIQSMEESETVRIKAGIFYSGIIAGCNCSDDPTPTDLQNEYCNLEFLIDKSSGTAQITILDK